MKNKIFIALMFFVQICSFQAQTQFEVDGVTVPRTIDFNGRKLELNGYGVRSKGWVDVYVQALYLTTLTQDPIFIIEDETPMAIRIQVTSALVSSKKLSKALYNGLEKSVGEEGMTKIQSQATAFENMINNEVTKKGDVFLMYYNPLENSILINKNEKLLGKIEGTEFKKAFFGIWLSNKPVDEDLKNDLLGKS